MTHAIFAEYFSHCEIGLLQGETLPAAGLDNRKHFQLIPVTVTQTAAVPMFFNIFYKLSKSRDTVEGPVKYR